MGDIRRMQAPDDVCRQQNLLDVHDDPIPSFRAHRRQGIQGKARGAPDRSRRGHRDPPGDLVQGAQSTWDQRRDRHHRQVVPILSLSARGLADVHG